MMELKEIERRHKNFVDRAQVENDVTYWFARDIQPLLEYTEWRNFVAVIERAKTSCEMAGQTVDNHFVDVNKMVDIGSGTTREINDLMLTRYACYLIVQNGDPSKEAIAFAQSYFAIQTRKQEMLLDRMVLTERLNARAKLSETERQLSATLFEHGVDEKGFGIIRSRGDKALFGGKTTSQMKERLGVKASRALADFLPTVTLKAKDFASSITDYNVRKNKLSGVNDIGREHEKNNTDIRQVLQKNDIIPEDLPPEEDIQKLERRVRSDENKLIKSETGLQSLLGKEGKSS